MANSPLKVIGIVASATIGVASAAYGAQKLIVRSLSKNEVDFEFRAEEQLEITTKDNAKIAVYCDGPEKLDKKKPTLLFLHGYALCTPIWSYQFDMLRETYNIVSIDLRGHGASSVGDNGVNLDSFADDVHEVINQLKLNNIVIVGHSTGGVVALSYLKNYEEHAKNHIVGLCLTSTLARPPYHNKKNVSEALSKLTFAGKTFQALSDLPAIGYPMARFAMGKKASSSVIEFVRRSIATTDTGVSDQVLRMLLNFSFVETLENFEGKSCVIVGASDPITPLSDALFVAELLGGEVDIIHGVGHLPMLESPDEFNEILNDFLEKFSE